VRHCKPIKWLKYINQHFIFTILISYQTLFNINLKKYILKSCFMKNWKNNYLNIIKRDKNIKIIF